MAPGQTQEEEWVTSCASATTGGSGWGWRRPGERPSVRAKAGGERRRVVIVGGGCGGLAAARGLRRADADVTVVDRMNHHLFQPLLYQVATGAISEGDCASPIRTHLKRQSNASVLMAEVTDFDLERRQVILDRGGQVGHRFEYAAADGLVIELPEPSFDHVQPRA